MKHGKIIIRIFAVLLAFAFFTASPFSFTALADDTSDDEYASMTNEEKQAVLEQKLKEVNEKLDSLGEEAEETEEYINTLDEKISYLQDELELAQDEIEESEQKIEDLQNQYEENEKQIEQLTQDVAALEVKTAELEENFNNNLSLYYKRLRALYISGETSTVAMLLTCDDLSSLFTRYEMIKRVSQSDRELLESIQTESTELSETKTEMEEKKNSLSSNQEELQATQVTLEETISSLETQQVDYSEKQEAYESEKSKSDALLKELEDEKQTYSEYRNQDQAELEAVNAEIAKAAEEFKKKMEAQTTTKATTTTQKSTTSSDDSDDETTTKKSTTTTTTTKQSDSSKLSMTYPVPSQTKITCDYGSAGYVGHTGVDFSCPTGSTVVAAESGYVFYTKKLNYSYGYHIVIMHDKTDSAGNYVYTLYAHNSELLVSEGDYVTKGQAIAKSGSTGNSTGPHCHFEVRTPTASYSNCVNPNYYLP